MGDEIPEENLDKLNFPKDLQSGNIDNGHISDLPAKLSGEQSTLLENHLNNFYTQNLGIGGKTNMLNSFITDLQEMGYTEQRATDIADSAVAENLYRHQHDGEPSGLSMNQLDFLYAVGGINQHIYSMRDGRQYINNDRQRGVDDAPTRQYLPAPIPFNPLTISQQAEVSQIEEIQSDIIIEPTDLDNLEEGFTHDQNNQISQITQHYLNSDHSRAEQLQFRSNIQQIQGLNQVNNIPDYLLGYFNDVENEIEYRDNNNGLPQLISQNQYDYLRANQRDSHYTGQPIYAVGGTANIYYYTPDGERKIVPIVNDELQKIIPDINIDTFQLPSSLTSYSNLVEDIPAGGLVRSDTRLILSPEQEELIKQNAVDTINDDMTYETFIQLLDTFPLSNEQFYDLSKMVADNSINPPSHQELIQTQKYLDYPIFYVSGSKPVSGDRVFTMLDENGYRTYMSRFNLDDVVLDNNIEVQKDNFVITHAQMLHQKEEKKVLLPKPLLPVIPVPTKTDDPMPQNVSRPQQITPFRPTTGPTEEQAIILPTETSSEGTTQEIENYEIYWENNQGLYVAFRDDFKDILPIFTGISGGFFALQFQRIRRNNAVNELLIDERNLLNELQGRIDIRLNRINELNIELDALAGFQGLEQQARREIVRRYADVADIQRFSPNIPVQEYIQQTEQLRDNLERIRNDITETRELLNFFNRVNTYDGEVRDKINIRINEIINRDYSILYDIYNYSPQILVGFSVGHTIGYILQGYMFPTYAEGMDNKYIVFEDDELKVLPAEDKNDVLIPPNDITNPSEKINKKKIISDPEYEDISQKSRMYNYKEPNFIPYKVNKNGKTLTYKEIQEYKSLLDKDELKRLAHKMLIFDENNNISEIKSDKCNQIQFENPENINIRKIRK